MKSYLHRDPCWDEEPSNSQATVLIQRPLVLMVLALVSPWPMQTEVVCANRHWIPTWGPLAARVDSVAMTPRDPRVTYSHNHKLETAL